MASKQIFTIFITFATFLPPIALAKDFMVGDDKGWRTGVDYQDWAKGKEFHVGDTLVFKYAQGSHNVNKVNGSAFEDCIIPPKNEALTTGRDEIKLAAPGRKWYICGVGKHCDGGQKLVITVLDSKSKNSATGIATYGFGVLISAILVTFLAIL